MMKNKKGLITGVANERSIAWAACKELAANGAEIAITYQNEKLERWVKPLAEEIGAIAIECDVSKKEHLEKLTNDLNTKWGSLDFFLHSVAYARKEELSGRFIDSSREGFLEAMDINVFSLLDMLKHLEPLLLKGNNPAIATMTYYGAEKVVPNYNVMGVAKAALEATVRYLAYDLGKNNIRVNAVSAGPVKTLAAVGIKDFRDMLKTVEEKAPLKRALNQSEVGKSCLYLLSDLASGVTGEIHYVDCGYNILGM